jgi:hypothetical protein
LPWREDRTRKAGNKRATPGRLRSFPVLAAKFPVFLLKFPVPSFREFVKNPSFISGLSVEKASVEASFAKNSLYFPC